MTRISPIHEVHKARGAKITEFGGWLMPLQYSGVIAEHLAVRERVGLFDVSHLGKLTVEGSGVAEALDAWLPGRVAKLREWTAGYNLVLSGEGGILDDIFVYRMPDSFILIPNAANTDLVLREAANELGGFDVNDARERWAIFALSGPSARDVASRTSEGIAEMKLHHVGAFTIYGAECLIARTGYTGEITFEFLVPWSHAAEVWQGLLSHGKDHGILPVGLGARDTLRLEMGYPLHGYEISAETNPIEAGLEWVIQWEKPEFKARRALEEINKKGIERKLVGLVAKNKGIPRSGYSVRHRGRVVGEVTSGNFSPVLGRGIALAYVPTEISENGTMLAVDVRGKTLDVQVTKPPFIGRGR